MARVLIMLVACVLVAGAMALLMLWFTRRLRKIEEKRWGDRALTKPGV